MKTDEPRVLSPFSVEYFKINKNNPNRSNMKIDDIKIITGFVVKEDEGLEES
jgi:hypothetical protein